MTQSQCRKCGEPIIWGRRADDPDRWHRPLGVASESFGFYVDQNEIVRNGVFYDIHTCRRKKVRSSNNDRYSNAVRHGHVSVSGKELSIESLAREHNCPIEYCSAPPGDRCRDVAEYMETDRVLYLLASHEARKAVAVNRATGSPLYGEASAESTALQEELAAISRKRKLVRTRIEAHTEKLREEAASVEAVGCSTCGAESGEPCWNLNSLKRGNKSAIISVHNGRLARYRRSERRRLYAVLATHMQRILDEAR